MSVVSSELVPTRAPTELSSLIEDRLAPGGYDVLLDENGNLIGVVSSKLDFLAEIKNAGDIPQNVNFAIKASVVANFLQDNAIKFQIGEATQPMKGPDLADEAKALSAFIVCR